MKTILRQAGFEDVLTVEDPRDVERVVRTTRPDVLLLDLRMPHLDGYDLLGVLGRMPGASDIPVLVVTSDDSPEAKRAALAKGANDFLTKPFDPEETVLRIKNLLEMRLLQTRLSEHNRLLEAQVRQRTTELWDLVRKLEAAERDLERSQAETVRRLATAAEFRDDETASHIVRMSEYCNLLARRAGIHDDTPELIQTASQMHDIGKIGTPDSILLKPAPLAPAERAVMERHTEHGWAILEGSDAPLLRLAATIALTHHERPDGAGYPRRLQGDDIPVAGRIAAIADVFDALSTDRVYRPALPLPEVWETLRAGRGTQFDPDLLDVFLDGMDEVLEIAQRNDGRASTRRRRGQASK